jgi:hypothetical protein
VLFRLGKKHIEHCRQFALMIRGDVESDAGNGLLAQP